MQTKPHACKDNSPADIARALQEMADLRDRLDWRRRDLRLMFIQSPQLKQWFEAFQQAGGITADEWLAYVANGQSPLRSVVARGHLRLLRSPHRGSEISEIPEQGFDIKPIS